MEYQIDFRKLEEIVEGSVLQRVDNPVIKDLVTDSRKATGTNPSLLFCAINGPNHNGHDYISELYDLGIRNFLLEERIDINSLPEANFILVDETIAAMQKLAAYKRALFKQPVIGITGSNAKTIIKEWLFMMLSSKYIMVRSPRSYNSQLGVPLSVWQLNRTDEMAIFEAGISHPDEMQHLKKVIEPNVGIFTNIGTAHEEGFESIEEKIREKLKLFVDADVIIYCQDHTLIHNIINENQDLKTFSWSQKEKADLSIKGLGEADFEIYFKNETFTLKSPFLDQPSQENLLHCVACLLYLGFDSASIQSCVNLISPVKMRLEMKKGLNGSYIIDDSYNNDLAGLETAIQFLQSQNQRSSKVLILSDIPQSSLKSEELYQKVNGLVEAAKIHRFIGIGSEISQQKSHFRTDAEFFKSTDEFLEQMDRYAFQDSTVLVKGARVFRFESITSRLVEKLHETVLEIDLDALTNNLNFYRSRLKRNTKLMVMVKALAYGSGSAEISNLLQFHKVDYLAVAYTDEGIDLRQNGVNLPIMVMNPKNDLQSLLDHQLEPEIFGLQQLQEFVNALTKGAQLKVHINVNTGMNRLGFEPNELKDALQIIENSKQIRVKSIFTHLAGSDAEEHKTFSLNQLGKFEAIAKDFEKELGYPIVKHALNSAGIINFPEYQMDMVRLGIGLHGFDPSGHSRSLQPVSSLKTVISQIKKISKGETIGYSRKGFASEDMTIATIALGYADGFSRAFSNGVGQVKVNGQSAKVIGNVCMDMTMIDITHIEAQEGDEVIVFGKEQSIKEMADLIDTIPYEVLTNVSTRVKRVYFTH